MTTSARAIRVRGVVQGVGFRPFVYRLAQANTLTGWVLNASEGVEIHLEGDEPGFAAFLDGLQRHPPPAARIAAIDVQTIPPAGLSDFTIRDSLRQPHPTTRISPDLPVCDDCLAELFDPANPRHHYPYINCTNCGPRYTILSALPYDRAHTTMRAWPLDEYCAHQYHDPADRRFHAQPVACPACGPHYFLRRSPERSDGSARSLEGLPTALRAERTQIQSHERSDWSGDEASIQTAALLLQQGKIVAIKSLGGYHLACDARNSASVNALRERKFRKEKPFALMARDLAVARTLIDLAPSAEALLLSIARPIVLAPAKVDLPGVAPDSHSLGVMLPYTPLHHLLFAASAPDALVMTSANRSNEPIAYQDEDAAARLAGIADAFLVGQRPIARRVDDSVVEAGPFGPMLLRRARGYAPGAVARLPASQPILALGADLKNAVTLVVEGQAFVAEHIGDLADYPSFESFQHTIDDLMTMYQVDWNNTLVVCDCHPQYRSTHYARELPAASIHMVQHHRAHIASVLAEREAWDKIVIGLSLDGTGYGDDGAIWGGEIFTGSIASGFNRVAHLRYASLPGGDAAARHPVQAAAGFLTQVDNLPDFAAPPFLFPERFQTAQLLVAKQLNTFPTTSTGRLFDTAAALLGFTRPVTFEGQAAMWLESLARTAPPVAPYLFPDLDFRPLLLALIEDRLRGRDPNEIARAFQRGLAEGFCHAARTLCEQHQTGTLVLSGGVFQNTLLLEDMKRSLSSTHLEVWTNHNVPPNDGGISLGQAALAAFEPSHVA